MTLVRDFYSVLSYSRRNRFSWSLYGDRLVGKLRNSTKDFTPLTAAYYLKTGRYVATDGLLFSSGAYVALGLRSRDLQNILRATASNTNNATRRNLMKSLGLVTKRKVSRAKI